jgi:outer membrane protein assembly factor BamB
LICRNGHTGAWVWQQDLSAILPKPISAASGSTIQTISPTFTQNDIILAAGRDQSGFVLALDTVSGKLRWLYASPLNGDTPGSRLKTRPNSPPVIVSDRIVLRMGGDLVALRLSDGKEIWRKPFEERLEVGASQSARPVVQGSTVFFNPDYGIGYAFDSKDGRLLWSRTTDGFAISGHDTIVNIHISFATASPVFLNGNLIIADGVGNTYALSPMDGAIQWKTNTSYVRQFLPVQGDLYAATKAGVIQLNPTTGKIIKNFATHGTVMNCALAGSHAVLSLREGGFIIFDLGRWKVDAHVENFNSIAPPIVDGNDVIVLGTEGPLSSDAIILRAYHIDSWIHKSR